MEDGARRRGHGPAAWRAASKSSVQPEPRRALPEQDAWSCQFRRPRLYRHEISKLLAQRTIDGDGHRIAVNGKGYCLDRPSLDLNDASSKGFWRVDEQGMRGESLIATDNTSLKFAPSFHAYTTASSKQFDVKKKNVSERDATLV